MAMNPYAAPPPVETKTEAERAAERRIAPVAMGVQVAAVLILLMGLFGVVALCFGSVIWWQVSSDFGDASAHLIWEMVQMASGTAIGLLLGSLALYAGRRLRRLDSKRWAYGACVLGMIAYPMCIVTLPLGIYGVLVLRRADVQAVLRERSALRQQRTSE